MSLTIKNFQDVFTQTLATSSQYTLPDILSEKLENPITRDMFKRYVADHPDAIQKSPLLSLALRKTEEYDLKAFALEDVVFLESSPFAIIMLKFKHWRENKFTEDDIKHESYLLSCKTRRKLGTIVSAEEFARSIDWLILYKENELITDKQLDEFAHVQFTDHHQEETILYYDDLEPYIPALEKLAERLPSFFIRLMTKQNSNRELPLNNPEIVTRALPLLKNLAETKPDLFLKLVSVQDSNRKAPLHQPVIQDLFKNLSNELSTSE